MMKNVMKYVFLLGVFAFSLTAEEKPDMPKPEGDFPGMVPPPPQRGRFMKYHGQRPAKETDPVFELIEKGDFSPEQKTRLKEMAEKDPRSAHKEMRQIMREKRRIWAKSILALREKCRSEKDPAKKTALEAQLKKELNADAERRLAMNRRMLDGMRKYIEDRQKELQTMQKRYEERVKEKDRFVEEETKRILSDNVPDHILKSAR